MSERRIHIGARPTLDSPEVNLSVLSPKTSKNLKRKSMSSDAPICNTLQPRSLSYWVCEKSDGIRLLFLVATDHASGSQSVYIVSSSDLAGITLIAFRSIDIIRIVN